MRCVAHVGVVRGETDRGPAESGCELWVEEVSREHHGAPMTAGARQATISVEGLGRGWEGERVRMGMLMGAVRGWPTMGRFEGAEVGRGTPAVVIAG